MQLLLVLLRVPLAQLDMVALLLHQQPVFQGLIQKMEYVQLVILAHIKHCLSNRLVSHAPLGVLVTMLQRILQFAVVDFIRIVVKLRVHLVLQVIFVQILVKVPSHVLWVTILLEGLLNAVNVHQVFNVPQCLSPQVLLEVSVQLVVIVIHRVLICPVQLVPMVL